MSNDFQLPERPWGDAEIKHLKAHAHLLNDEVRAELGLGPVPVEESTPSTESTETVDTPEETATETNEEVTEPETKNTVETEEKVEGEETVEKLDADNA